MTAVLVDSAVPIFASSLILYHAARFLLKGFPRAYPLLRRSWTYGAMACLLGLMIYLQHFHAGGTVVAPKPFIYFQF